MKRKTEEKPSGFFNKSKKIFNGDRLNWGLNPIRSSFQGAFDTPQDGPDDKQPLIKAYEFFAHYFKELNKTRSLRQRKESIKEDLGMLIKEHDFLLDFHPVFYLLISQVLNEKKQPLLAAKFLKKSMNPENLKTEHLETLIEIGDTLINQKNFLMGEKIARSAFNLSEKIPATEKLTKKQAVLLLVKALLSQEKLRQAYDVICAFNLQDVQTQIFTLFIGRNLEKLGSEIGHLTEVLKTCGGKEGGPEHIKVLRNLILAYGKFGDFDSAENMISVALLFEEHPLDQVQDRILQVDILVKKGDLASAEIFLAQIIKESPDFVASSHYYLLGKILKKQKKFDEAEKLIRPIAFAERTPEIERIEFLRLLSKILERRGEFAQAQEITEIAIGMLDPKDSSMLPELQMRLGNLQSFQNRHSQAKQSFKKALFTAGFFAENKEFDAFPETVSNRMDLS